MVEKCQTVMQITKTQRENDKDDELTPKIRSLKNADVIFEISRIVVTAKTRGWRSSPDP
jgi:hypothetical protein